MNHSRLARRALGAYTIVFYIALYGPMLVLALLSFNDSDITGLPFKGWTWRWYETAFSSRALMDALVNSFGVGLLAALAGTMLALLLALAFRRQIRFQGLIFNLVLLPVIIPGIVGGIVLLIFFGYLGIPPGLYTTVLLAHINWVLPFAFLTLYPRVHAFDRALEEAAMDLGARPLQVMRRVVLPVLAPALLATVMFSFTLSFDEFVRTLFVTGFDATVPIAFWNLVVLQLAPFLPAMAMIITVISIAASLLGFIFTRNSRAADPSHRIA